MIVKHQFRGRAAAAASTLFLLMSAVSCGGQPAADGVRKDATPAAANPAPGAGQKPGGAQANRQGSGRRAQAIPVQVTLVKWDQLISNRSTAGVVSPVQQSQVAVPTGGIVLRVPRKAGDDVAEGDAVVQMDDSQAKLALANAQTALETARINLVSNQDSTSQANVKLTYQVDAAQAAYNSAKKNYDSQKALFDLGGISAAALDTAQSNLTAAGANLETAKTALDMNKRGVSTTTSQNIDALKVAIATAENNVKIAELNLRNMTVRAPFDGRISVMNANPGMFLGQNTTAFTIVAERRQITFNVAPSDAPALPSGSPVVFEISGQSYKVRTTQSPAAPVNALVPLTAAMPQSLKVPFGSVGTVRFPVSMATGTLVPITALISSESRNYVFIAADGKALRREVSILAESDVTAAVSGIEPGDSVIMNAPPGLVEGSAVQAISSDAAAGPKKEAPETQEKREGKKGNYKKGDGTKSQGGK